MKKYKKLKFHYGVKIVYIVVGILVLIILAAIFLYCSNFKNSAQDLLQTYTNDTYHFSFLYSKDYAVSSLADGAPDPATGETPTVILVQNDSAPASAQKEFQVYITPFNEPDTTLTKERLLKEIPTLSIINPEQVSIAGQKGGLFFKSKTNNDTERNIWFVANNHLYQITAPLSFDPTLQSILSSWKFVQ